ncbi:hypothetical protein ACVWYG_001373 [Pedobacter sp. UYEF25]
MQLRVFNHAHFFHMKEFAFNNKILSVNLPPNYAANKNII